MFIETSRPRELGDRARLVSPLYNASAKFYCVSFFYHMYGKHIGESGDQESAPACWGWGQRGVPRRLGTATWGLDFPAWMNPRSLEGCGQNMCKWGSRASLCGVLRCSGYLSVGGSGSSRMRWGNN